MSGGKSNKQVMPQGGVISPLLANLDHEPVPEQRPRSVPQPRLDPLEQLAHGAKWCYPIPCGTPKNVSVGCNKCFILWSISIM